MYVIKTEEVAFWRDGETSSRKTLTSPVSLRDLTFDNYDLEDREPRHMSEM